MSCKYIYYISTKGAVRGSEGVPIRRVCATVVAARAASPDLCRSSALGCTTDDMIAATPTPSNWAVRHWAHFLAVGIAGLAVFVTALPGAWLGLVIAGWALAVFLFLGWPYFVSQQSVKKLA